MATLTATSVQDRLSSDKVSAITGTWAMTWCDNLDNFFEATKASDEFMKLYNIKDAKAKIAADPNYLVKAITVDTIENTYRFTMALAGELVHDTGLLKIGKEIDYLVPDGRTVKVFIENLSEKHVKITKTAEDFKSVLHITVDDKDVMTKAMTCNGVTGTETFRRI